LNWMKFLSASLALSLSGALILAAISLKAPAETKQEYKIGERLPATKPTVPAANISYRKLNWDELMPADWDPMKPLKGLDLNKLQDADPKAMEALGKAKESWNNAPVDPKLNGQHVEIPGFVVPLDVDPNKVKEFLLVPYFGACIHVPPPPSNQLIHVLTTRPLTKEQQKMLRNALLMQSAVSVSGLLETMSANTSMGVSSYRLSAELVELYKPPESK